MPDQPHQKITLLSIWGHRQRRIVQPSIWGHRQPRMILLNTGDRQLTVAFTAGNRATPLSN
ncbi:hypothetical protein PanABDRAFT_1343 [Pantoea sp. aB]|nr:hypothetical protein PanABDRAFT_1343 [Pantoea sp. aB]